MPIAEIPLELSAVAQPGVMISQGWPQSRAVAGATLRAIETVLARHPFFEAFQTVDIPDANERAAVRRRLHDAGHPHNYTLTRVFADAGLNLSALAPDVRRRSWEKAVQQLDEAEAAGASVVAVISGPRPAEPERRGDALQALTESMQHIAAAIAPRNGLTLELEPLDYEAHKRNTLGTTAEAVAICRELAATGRRLTLCLDTAHLILNRENPVSAVQAAREFIAEFHFCNCVTDRSHPLFGDRHLPFGPPGLVGTREMAVIMAGLYRGGYFSTTSRPRIFCEVWKPDDWDSLAAVAHCEDSLREAWRQARTLLLSPSV